ncbi:GntR family transcriptional regulator [Nocardia farcinica]|uniref:GntR family transcriptional regulator n=1 Tax=Nocardia farcinica TaxID=37329 RepID=UPI000A38731F|nr:GntR family transcriptional regulator [Nocardia farcinica]MBA4856312.1 GntR family transcriptional regulator [Nocardia farcinica]MBC9814133.1 GntR family transcriptional regulator [Nocardia farcinica]MBF6383651.1 GntR family transcriptional regulator [Nocardia farcinica]MBF6537253.1 GntR family transcriptional regulator [Nocardia farcinica]
MVAQPAALLGLEKTSLRQQAVAALRSAITSGALAPSSPLVETELSEKLAISRGTLREAMRQLQQEGLITAGPRGRLYVRHLDEKEIRDIFAVRAALESLAVRELAERTDRAELIPTLRRALDAMARAEHSLDERIEADLDFHRVLCRLTGNETLLHSWQSLEGSIRMSIMWAGLDKAVGNMDVGRHHAIVDAIETGDADEAAAAVRRHMKGAADNLVS